MWVHLFYFYLILGSLYFIFKLSNVCAFMFFRDIFNLVGCLLEPATLKTQFYMALLYTATTAILTAQIVYYGHICHRLEANKACKPEKIDELEYKAKESLVGKNSDERGKS
ncbi:uncharacterized protein LOC114581327 [Dendrobium catenatum]|uniref:uncharacterized protein LOC114581327 n=1 Tax=Dendrobium catenatum TaxID=906689 RepID=UPI00109F81C2|nr:uncharacterized protein LOC114581327 [Dendrobium catenatum]